MNKKCCGLFGRIFGHKFESMIMDYKYPSNKNIQFEHGCTATVKALADKKYRVICKRCGCNGEV